MDRRNLMIDDAPFGLNQIEFMHFLLSLTMEEAKELDTIYTDEEFAEFRKRIGK